MPRCFLAITLPESVQKTLTQFMPVAKSGVSRVRTDQMHLTLHFLGEVPQTKLEILIRALSAIDESSFELEIKGLGAFPNSMSPRILWAGVEFSKGLETLHAHMETLLVESIGYVPEKRPYSPHITIARMKTNSSREEIRQLIEQYKNFSLPIVQVRHFGLFESTLSQEGPVYREIQSFPLR